jgi:hypothetical protein
MKKLLSLSTTMTLLCASAYAETAISEQVEKKDVEMAPTIDNQLSHNENEEVDEEIQELLCSTEDEKIDEPEETQG